MMDLSLCEGVDSERRSVPRNFLLQVGYKVCADWPECRAIGTLWPELPGQIVPRFTKNRDSGRSAARKQNPSRSSGIWPDIRHRWASRCKRKNADFEQRYRNCAAVG